MRCTFIAACDHADGGAGGVAAFADSVSNGGCAVQVAAAAVGIQSPGTQVIFKIFVCDAVTVVIGSVTDFFCGSAGIASHPALSRVTALFAKADAVAIAALTASFSAIAGSVALAASRGGDAKCTGCIPSFAATGIRIGNNNIIAGVRSRNVPTSRSIIRINSFNII